MEMWENTAVIKISRQPTPIEIMMDEKQQKTVGYFNQEGLHVNSNPGLIWQEKTQQEDPFHHQIEYKLK